MAVDMSSRQRKLKNYATDYTNFDFEHGFVIGEHTVGLWKVRCKHCGDIHIYETRSLKNKTHSKQCKQRKPHNYSGLDRWDAIIRRQYGISLKQYDDMLEAQGGGCAICGAKEDVVKGRRLSIDHCDETGKVRGILCARCNQGIGSLQDNPHIIIKAAHYLTNAR